MEDIKKPRKIKIDHEKVVFVICVFVTIIILVKIFYIVLYHFKAQEVFHNKPVCETYKSLYASELNKGEVADIQPILHQAEGVDCVKIVDSKKKKEKEEKHVEPKKEVKEEKAYNALTIHEIEK